MKIRHDYMRCETLTRSWLLVKSVQERRTQCLTAHVIMGNGSLMKIATSPLDKLGQRWVTTSLGDVGSVELSSVGVVHTT
jgi:hypothetical protein